MKDNHDPPSVDFFATKNYRLERNLTWQKQKTLKQAMIK